MFRYACIAIVIGFYMQAAMAADATIKGTLAIGGEDIPLSHAMVVDFDDAEDMGDGPELRVLFSESEIAQSELEAPVLFNLDAQARAGKLRGVLLRFDPSAESREVHGTVYLTPDNPQTSMPFFTLGGTSGGVDTLSVDGAMLSGTLENSAEGDADFGIPSYSFELTFSAPIQKSTPVTVLKGKEAMDSLQMKTLIQFEEALREGDFETIRKLGSPAKANQIDEFVAQVGKDKFLEMAKQMVADPATHEKNIVGMYLRGNLTTFVFKDEGGKMSMTLSKSDDGWIVD